MSLGGGGGSQKVKVKRTKEEKEAQRLYVESLRLRNQFLPFLMQDYGFGTDASGNLSRLPKTAQQQGIDDLALTSLGGAQQAAQMMQQRLQMGQSMLPGLMRSVQASMAPGMRPGWGGSQAPNAPIMSPGQAPPTPLPTAPTQPPPGPITGPLSQFFAGIPSDDTVHERLKSEGYGKSQRRAMPVSTALSLMGGNMDALTPALTESGVSMDAPLKEFFAGAPFNTGDYDFTLQQILSMLGLGK